MLPLLACSAHKTVGEWGGSAYIYIYGVCETAATAHTTAVTLTMYLQSSCGHLSVYVCVTICVYMYGVCVGAYLNITTCWGYRFRVLYNFELRLNLRPAIQRSSLYIYIHTHICVFTVLLSPLYVCDYLFT